MLALTLYGIPASVSTHFRRLWKGSAGAILWRLFVTCLLALVSYGLLTMGGYGAVIAGILVSTLISDDVRQFVRDIWTRDWAEVPSPW